MQQQQQSVHPARRSRRTIISLVARITLFSGFILFLIATGVFIAITGAHSTATLLSGGSTIILGVASVIQIYPVFFPQSTPVNTSSSSIQNTNNTQNANVNTAQPTFLFNLPLRDPNDFYGRLATRTTLITRISHGGSSSIIGERRLGKTWLLTYLQLIAPAHSMLGSAYRIGYVSASHPQCKSVANFVQRALEELKVLPHSIDLTQPPLSQLSQGVRDMKKLGLFPVLCIDEFEGFNNKQEFNNDFMEGLRALAQDDGLVLVTASKHPLKEIIENLTGQTSPLFNIVQQMRLLPFTELEARDFVCDKSDKATFNAKERDYFLQCGKLYNTNGETYWPPLRLQLVGQMLLDEKLATQGNSTGNQLDDVRYQSEFKHRLDEAYMAIVRTS